MSRHFSAPGRFFAPDPVEIFPLLVNPAWFRTLLFLFAAPLPPGIVFCSSIFVFRFSVFVVALLFLFPAPQEQQTSPFAKARRALLFPSL